MDPVSSTIQEGTRGFVPLRRKLVVFTLCTAVLSGLLVCAAFVLVASYQLNGEMAIRMAGVARLNAIEDAAAIATVNPGGAISALQNLMFARQILAAGIYDQSGRLTASYVRPGVDVVLPQQQPVDRSRDKLGVLWMVRPVVHAGVPLGSLCLVANAFGLAQPVMQNLGESTLVLFLCVSVLALALLRFLRSTTEPILSLTRTAQMISAQRDYSQRVDSPSNDEVGDLVAAFNDMLEQLESRKAELAEHQNHLEQLVEDRTRALVAALDKAEEGGRLKSQFLANMSHEIRTPLNGVLGMTHLVLGTSLDQEQREYIQTIQWSADTLLAVINDVLDFSKIEADCLELEHLPFSPRHVMEGSVRTLAFKAAEKGIGLRWEASPDVPSLVTGDPTRIQQILLNLLGNAVKFTSSGDVLLKACGSQSGSGVRFSVEDTGIGIPETQLAAIFEPFRQADGSVTRKYGGTGLGLSIVAKLTKMMGGESGVSSVVGRGSCFWVDIPLPVADPDTAASQGPVEEVLSPLPALSILVAEDNPVNQRVVKRLLQTMGHTVLVASTGAEAVELYQAGRFDLILMDVQMPVMSGLDATAKIRAGGHGVPIIAVTAHAVKGDRERFLAAGMDDYLSKPIRVDELAAALGRAVQKTLAENII